MNIPLYCTSSSQVCFRICSRNSRNSVSSSYKNIKCNFFTNESPDWIKGCIHCLSTNMPSTTACHCFETRFIQTQVSMVAWLASYEDRIRARMSGFSIISVIYVVARTWSSFALPLTSAKDPASNCGPMLRRWWVHSLDVKFCFSTMLFWPTGFDTPDLEEILSGNKFLNNFAWSCKLQRHAWARRGTRGDVFKVWTRARTKSSTSHLGLRTRS